MLGRLRMFYVTSGRNLKYRQLSLSICIITWFETLIPVFKKWNLEEAGNLFTLKESMSWTSLVVQWLRICLPMQGTQVQSLVGEGPTCRRAVKPVSCNYWSPCPWPNNQGSHRVRWMQRGAGTHTHHHMWDRSPTEVCSDSGSSAQGPVTAPRGRKGGRGRRAGEGEARAHPRPIHAAVRQAWSQCCRAIILQWKCMSFVLKATPKRSPAP